MLALVHSSHAGHVLEPVMSLENLTSIVTASAL